MRDIGNSLNLAVLVVEVLIRDSRLLVWGGDSTGTSTSSMRFIVFGLDVTVLYVISILRAIALLALSPGGSSYPHGPPHVPKGMQETIDSRCY